LDGAPMQEWDLGPSLLESMWRFRRLVVAIVAIAALAGFGLSYLQPKMYEGTTSLILSDPRNAGVLGETRLVIDPSRYVRNQAERITSTDVLARAVMLEGGRISVQVLRSRVTVSPSTNLDLITIRALDPTSEGAASLADSVGRAYQQAVASEVSANAEEALAELDRSRADTQTQIDVLDSRLAADPADSTAKAERDAAVAQLVALKTRAEQISVDAALYGSGVELFEESEIPESPASPQPVRNAAVAAVLGLLGAGAYAWWRAEHTQSAESRHDAAPVLGAPLLGEVPEFGAVGTEGIIPTVTAVGSTVAEAFQFVVTSLEFALKGAGSTVVITSADQGDGKTVTALNLAVAAAKDGRKVLLVDADERVRGLTRFSGVDPVPGLTDLAGGTVSLDACIRPWSVENGTVVPLITAGSSLGDAAGFFRTVAFREAMTQIRQSADIVLVDTPPLLAVSDTSAVAGQADGIVLVVSRGTPLRHLEDVRDRLSFVGTPLLGYIFNRADPNDAKYGYKYKYGYGYGYISDPDGKRRHRRSGDAGR
jgi:capsular exopolysaccharide synthesis family protein